MKHSPPPSLLVFSLLSSLHKALSLSLSTSRLFKLRRSLHPNANICFQRPLELSLKYWTARLSFFQDLNTPCCMLWVRNQKVDNKNTFRSLKGVCEVLVGQCAVSGKCRVSSLCKSFNITQFFCLFLFNGPTSSLILKPLEQYRSNRL